MKRFLPFILIFGVGLLAFGAGTMLYRAHQEPVSAPIPGELASTNPGAKPPHIRGTPDAPVVLEEFGDLQCPPCAILAMGLKAIERDYSGRVRVIFRHFPLAMHPHAVEAAQAAEAAGMQGHFWEMTDLLYENQASWSKGPAVQPFFEEYARKLGLDLERFKADQPKQSTLARIGLDNQRGASLGVSATPTLFVNNQRVPQQSMNDAGLRAALDAALEGKNPFPTPTPTPALSAAPTR
ncbi:MAG TPA: thioredoxin domain-containing protein [Chthoniobacterales bacterium]|nr:thioredoxin domain-containing protein [Chthoniobacterales bacterium]